MPEADAVTVPSDKPLQLMSVPNAVTEGSAWMVMGMVMDSEQLPTVVVNWTLYVPAEPQETPETLFPEAEDGVPDGKFHA